MLLTKGLEFIGKEPPLFCLTFIPWWSFHFASQHTTWTSRNTQALVIWIWGIMLSSSDSNHSWKIRNKNFILVTQYALDHKHPLAINWLTLRRLYLRLGVNYIFHKSFSFPGLVLITIVPCPSTMISLSSPNCIDNFLISSSFLKNNNYQSTKQLLHL